MLKAAGCTFDDIVDVTTFHTDPEAQFGTFMAVRSKHLGAKPCPTITAIGVSWLYGFDFSPPISCWNTPELWDGLKGLEQVGDAP